MAEHVDFGDAVVTVEELASVVRLALPAGVRTIRCDRVLLGVFANLRFDDVFADHARSLERVDGPRSPAGWSRTRLAYPRLKTFISYNPWNRVSTCATGASAYSASHGYNGDSPTHRLTQRFGAHEGLVDYARFPTERAFTGFPTDVERMCVVALVGFEDEREEFREEYEEDFGEAPLDDDEWRASVDGLLASTRLDALQLEFSACFLDSAPDAVLDMHLKSLACSPHVADECQEETEDDIEDGGVYIRAIDAEDVLLLVDQDPDLNYRRRQQILKDALSRHIHGDLPARLRTLHVSARSLDRAGVIALVRSIAACDTLWAVSIAHVSERYAPTLIEALRVGRWPSVVDIWLNRAGIDRDLDAVEVPLRRGRIAAYRTFASIGSACAAVAFQSTLDRSRAR